ncbi:MAG TPA: hypothetical protein VGJ15_11475 [Pirellulales bacterium]
MRALFEAGKRLAETENQELLKTVRKHNARELAELQEQLGWLDEIELAKLIQSLYSPASLASQAINKHFQAQGKVLRGYPFDGSSETIRLRLAEALPAMIRNFIAEVNADDLYSTTQWQAELHQREQSSADAKSRAKKK